MLIRAVLFDLDDTLYPQEAWLAGAWRAVAAAAPRDVGRAELHAALVEVAAEGTDRGRIIDRALDRIGRAEVDVAPLVAAFRRYDAPTLVPYAGTRAALEAVRRRLPVGLVSDGWPAGQRSKLAALGLDDAFDAVVWSDELGRGRRKPDPAPFLAAAARLGVEPAACVYVGDRPDKDVAGAVRAGFAGAVRVRTGEYAAVPDPPEALASVDTVADAAAWIVAGLPAGQRSA